MSQTLEQTLHRAFPRLVRDHTMNVVHQGATYELQHFVPSQQMLQDFALEEKIGIPKDADEMFWYEMLEKYLIFQCEYHGLRYLYIQTDNEYGDVIFYRRLQDASDSRR